MNTFIRSFLLLAISLNAAVFCKEETPTFTIIENQAKIPILNSTLADRKIRKLRLSNGLEALLVSDPNTPQSGGVLTVEVGSWSDPDEYPGLAHFLEHMLFLGTKKYPAEGGYQAYISEHGGITNAFTMNDSTSFLFTVNNDALTGALDRFSEFFKEPTFTPSGVGRELRAIDQEFNKNIEKDEIRELFVMKENSNPKHPQVRFTAGNTATLGKVDRETFIKWYNEHYSANLMHLIVYSTMPIDELQDIVVSKFSDIPDHHASKKTLDPNLEAHTESLNGQIIYIQPIKNLRQLSFVWNLPSKFHDMYETQPENLVCYVLGHEGKDSLLAQLKREKLAEGLKCGAGKVGSNTMFFYIEIDLTDEGLKKYDLIAERVFQAIQGFKEQGIPQYLYDEVHSIGKIHYQYQSRPDLFSDLERQATDITDEKLETYPERTQIIQRFDPQAVVDMFSSLTPSKALLILSAPSSMTGVKPDREEKFMKIPYAIRPIPQQLLASWSQVQKHPDISLPPPNVFIPKHLELVNKNIPKDDRLVPIPKAIMDDKTAKIYYTPDTYYNQPEVFVWFEIKTPEIETGKAMKVVLGDLFIKSVNDAISKFSYDALVAGLDYSVDRTDNGIGITLKGYSENAPLLFAEIIKRLKEIHPSDDKFDIYKQSLIRQYQNTYKESPLSQASELLKSLTYRNFTTDRQKSSAIRKVTFEKFNQFLAGVFNQTYIEGLVYGNMTEDQAKDLSKQLIGTLGGVPYPKNEQFKKYVIVLPNEGPFYVEAKTKSKGNAGILAIEVSSGYSLKERAAQQILSQAMEEPFFRELRTKQQTGYSIGNSADEIEKHLFNYFAVLSNTHDVRDLLARFELFIEGFLQEMDKTGFTQDNFEQVKTSLVGILRQRQNNIEDMGKLLKTLAFKYDGDFDWLNKRIKAFEELTYPEFVQLAEKMLGKSNKKRFAVLMKGAMPETNTLDYQKLNDINQLRKLSTYTPK
jgi:insulysin